MEFLNVCLNDSNGNPSKIYVFSGGNKIEPSKLFRAIDLIEFEKHDIEYIYVEQYIYKDDNIKNIKRKILDALKYEMSYPEIYLYAKTSSEYSLDDIFNNIIKDTNNDFVNYEQVKQLINNFVNFDIEIPKKDEYSASDLYDLNIPSTIDFFNPIGSQFSDYYDFMFSANPFLLQSSNLYSNNRSNTLITLDNSLLLDYNITNNVIYLSCASDMLTFFSNVGINEEFIINTYYPFLVNENITNLNSLTSQKSKLISKDKTKIKTNSKKYFDQINLLNDIYYKNDLPLKYLKSGINNIKLTIFLFNSYTLPLDNVFKILHASQDVPFIKFNPGKKKENIFRIYSNSKSKNGKRIPYLNRVKLINLSKIIGKGKKQISFFYNLNYESQVFEIYIDLLENGNFNLEIVSSDFFDYGLLDNIINKSINPIISNINKFLEQFGYSINYYKSLKDNNINFNSIDYNKSISLKKKFNYDKYVNLFSSIFDVLENQKNNKIELNYKRVSNFKKMDGINKIIHNLKPNSNKDNVSEVINLLINNYNISENDALNHITNYFNNFTMLNGKNVNKFDSVIENPGFSASINAIPFEDLLIFNMSEINNIEYIKHIDIFIDSVFRLMQYPDSIKIPKNKITNIINKEIKEDVIDDKPMLIVPNITQPITFKKAVDLDIEPSESIINNHFVKHNEEKDSDDDSDDGLFFDDYDDMENDDIENDDMENDDMENDDMENDDIITGGSKVESITGMELKKPNLFFDRLIKRDPALFLTKKDGKFNAYSRLCQHNAGKQPVILNQEEKDYIDNNYRDSYSHSIEYGSDPNNKYHYICPRFWCLKTNSSISEEDVKAGKCGKIIPKDADKVPKGYGVIEFHEKRTEIDENGEEKEVFNVPGFLKNGSHPDGLCVPCCFKKDWDSKLQKNRREQCLEGNKDAAKKYEKQEYETSYIISYDTSPLPKNRFGFLPPAIEQFLREDYTKKVNPDNNHILLKDKYVLLRYGTEQNIKQSFLGIVSEIYKNMNGEKKLPSIREMKDIIIKNMNIDKFIRLQNGTLINTFKPIKDYNIDINPYVNCNLFKKIDSKDEMQKSFFKSVVMSYNNFINYIDDDNNIIDHTYLWDMLSLKDMGIFKDGANIVIFEVLNNDVTNNIEILCPNNSYSSVKFDTNKPVVLIIKHNEYYELVVAIKIISDKTEDSPFISVIHKNRISQYNDVIFNVIAKIMNHKCKPISNSKTYDFKTNKHAIEIYNTLLNMEYEIKYQVLNYQSKCIGLLVNNNLKHDVYIPCYPSRIFKNIDIKFMDDTTIYNDYQYTKTQLLDIAKKSKNEILCKPSKKVLENNLIVGIITETNQFIQINPPSENIIKDNLETISGYNYISIDKDIFSNNSLDQERVDIYNKIKLEGLFYNAFRNTVKILLNHRMYKKHKIKLIERINDNSIIYQEKLNNVEEFLRYFVGDYISFVDYDEKVLKKLDNISNCLNNPSDKSYCLFNNNTYNLLLPKKHLFTNYENEKIYYFRLADEIIRYKHIQDFLLNSKNILTFENTNYNINNDEFILIQSLLDKDYFDDIEPLPKNDYVNNITYDEANPEYIDKKEYQIDSEEQDFIESSKDLEFTTKLISLDCIKYVKQINENNQDIWNKHFKGSREIFLKPIEICSFNLIRILVYFKFGLKLSINDVKNYILNTYTKFDKYQSKIISILKSQGKIEMMKLIENKSITMKDLIYSENYYVTDLDILAFIEGIKNNEKNIYTFKIILFSDEKFKTLNSNINWLSLDNDDSDILNNNYYFIRVPNIITNNKSMSYSIIETPFKLFNSKDIDLNNIKTHINKNIYTFESLLKKYKLK